MWRYGERPGTGKAWNEALQLGYPVKMDSVGVSPIGRYFELQPGVESESERQWRTTLEVGQLVLQDGRLAWRECPWQKVGMDNQMHLELFDRRLVANVMAA